MAETHTSHTRTPESALRAPVVPNLPLAALSASLALFLTGCTTILDREPRACYSAAQTVQAMTNCTELHKPWEPSLTDWISQPVTELERHIAERKREQRTEQN